jgi:hypothetical protein
LADSFKIDDKLDEFESVNDSYNEFIGQQNRQNTQPQLRERSATTKQAAPQFRLAKQ